MLSTRDIVINAESDTSCARTIELLEMEEDKCGIIALSDLSSRLHEIFHRSKVHHYFQDTSTIFAFAPANNSSIQLSLPVQLQDGFHSSTHANDPYNI